MTNSTVFGIPYLASQQASPEIAHNFALYMIEAMLRGVKAIQNAPPVGPADGDTYIVGTAGSGAWAGKNNCVAIYASNAWRFVPGFNTLGAQIPMGVAQEGMRLYVQDKDTYYRWTGSAWTAQVLIAVDIDNAFVVTRNTPSYRLPFTDLIAQFIGRDGGPSAAIHIGGFGVNPSLGFSRANGTSASPTAVLVDDIILNHSARGFGTTEWSSVSKGGFRILAAENWTDSAQGTRLLMQTSPLGTDYNVGATTRAAIEADGRFFIFSSDASSSGIGARAENNADQSSGCFYESFFDVTSATTGATSVGGFRARARNNSGTDIVFGVINFLASNKAAGAETSTFDVRTRQAGSSPTIRATIGAGMFMAGATGGDQGGGTFNGTAIYDDGVLLCAPLHMDDKKRHSQKFWDGLVPDALQVIEPDGPDENPKVLRTVTKHRTAQRHFDMLADGFDPMNPRAWVDRMRTDRAIPGMPTLEEHEKRYPVVDGERVAVDKYSQHERAERLALALDYMGLTVASLLDRIEALEKR